MGIRLSIGGVEYEAANYSVQEDSTPTKSEDSSGSVGVFTFSIPKTPNMQPLMLVGESVDLIDTRRGTTVGFVSSVTETDNGEVSLQCQSRLGRLNIYGVQAQPFSGSLVNAFRYYLGLANQEFDLLVDPSISSRTVHFPGWSGELWFYLKQMAAAEDCEISLVSNVILLRPLRQREAIDHRNVSRSRDYGSNTLAKSVEVYHYDNRPIFEELVYPPGGWSNDVEIISVGAGETVEVPLELSASVSSIVQPVMQTFVGPNDTANSVYTVVGDDGLPVVPQQWFDNGGRLSVSINPDTVTLTVTVTGATNIINSDGTPILVYQLALASDTTGSRYSTLRIKGSGIGFNKQKIAVRTCIDDQLAGTDVGITIDNPFLTTLDQAYSAGVKAARLYAGHVMVINGQMTTINQLGDNGSAAYPRYEQDQESFEGLTYANVNALCGVSTYADIEDFYYNEVRNDFDNQVFGNANGARVWDRNTARYYRIRSATIATDVIDFNAEDDLVHSDVEEARTTVTYADDKAEFINMTYTQRDRIGVGYV